MTTPVGLRAQVSADLARLSGTDPEDWVLMSKGRHALLVVLGVLPAGEVVSQPFTCLTAVAPGIATGHRPRYVDIDPATLGPDASALAGALGPDTRAVVVQHTLGPAADVAGVRAAAGEDVLVVEDAAHCLGHVDRAADVSVHSLGLEKLTPTRSGAAVWLNPARRGTAWYEALRAALEVLPEGGVRESVAHRLGTPVRRIASRFGRPGRLVLDRATDAGLVDAAITPSELRGEVAGRPTLLSGPALQRAVSVLPGLPANQERRRRVAHAYREGLADLPGVHVPEALDDPSLALVRYPVLLPSAEAAERAFAELTRAGTVPGRWYRPLLFPGPADEALFAYRAGSCPVAEDVSARIVNLPTADFATPELVARAVAVLTSVVGTEATHPGRTA